MAFSQTYTFWDILEFSGVALRDLYSLVAWRDKKKLRKRLPQAQPFPLSHRLYGVF